jgi:hypothetical protein|tara:strand:- start:5436 stop:6002 length:567 start_codon:yes stop_codon:yes gene_type:complete
MANNDFAFGLRPVRTLGGTANFTANEYTIPSGASNAIFQGSLVIMHADGDIDIAAGSSADIVGVFNGCFYTDPTTKKPTFSNFYPGSIAASDIVAQVYDDPRIVFEVQCDGTLAATAVGENADTTSTTSGSTVTGLSSTEISSTTGASTAQLRIIGISKDPDNSDTGSANTNAYVLINEHAYTQTAGT